MGAALVVVGASLGGLHALEAVLGALPADYPLPVAVAQHRDRDESLLGAALRHRSRLPVGDAEDKEPIRPGRVFLAPAGYHLLSEGDGFALSTEGPIGFALPSIDALFESAADAWGARTVGVVLTGANRDGVRGAARLRRRGALVIVQDPATAAAPTLPAAAIAAGVAGLVLPLEAIGPMLATLGLPSAG
jgi:two-component system, chemotaxis family, protein-glutamate methylesterase/glutaminase